MKSAVGAKIDQYTAEKGTQNVDPAFLEIFSDEKSESQ